MSPFLGTCERAITYRGVGRQVVGRLYLRKVGGRWVVLFYPGGGDDEQRLASVTTRAEGLDAFERARERIARSLGGR